MMDYYNDNAEQFYAGTVSLDVRLLYGPFVRLLPDGASILDAGCGSGRDSLEFIGMGYRITALDASEKLVEMSSQLIGQPVLHMTFQEMTFVEEFDGIWACASLLHVSRAEIDDALDRLTDALRPGGVLYASFRHGDGEEERDGRLFNSYDEGSFCDLLARHPRLELIRTWSTADVRPDRKGLRWFNVLVRKPHRTV